MTFELGKQYIVEVTKNGIVPTEEFKRERFFDKDSDDLDFLTDEEKTTVINDVLDKIKAEIEQIEINGHIRDVECFSAGINTALNVIDKYRNKVNE